MLFPTTEAKLQSKPEYTWYSYQLYCFTPFYWSCMAKFYRAPGKMFKLNIMGKLLKWSMCAIILINFPFHLNLTSLIDLPGGYVACYKNFLAFRLC